MKGDFSRIPFDPFKHYGGVLHQQGRVWLDSDWNEDVLERLATAQREIRDIVGFCGVPSPGSAFRAFREYDAQCSDDFNISAGRCYVDGIPCTIENATSYHTQPDLPDAPAITHANQRHADGGSVPRSVAADDYVSGGSGDSGNRAGRTGHFGAAQDPGADSRRSLAGRTGESDLCASFHDHSHSRPGHAHHAATAPQPQSQCQLPDPANYTGRENRLYRVEIHDGGDPGEAERAFRLLSPRTRQPEALRSRSPSR